MIKLTRLRLINWHNFHDDLIEFGTISYFLGDNAVGKTTIMDAIKYCLTTNKEFNSAGNKKSGRTLLGFVHQKERAENSYLRFGHTVSYIGVEFLDESIGKTFVIIARIESETPKQDLKGVSQDWYITKSGYALEDIPFFTPFKDGKRPTSRDAFKLVNKGMDRASNQADARRRICRMLGIGEAESPIGKKFNEVFHMGTSLDDIKDIRQFIYTYILPEPEVNIDFLKKDMHELERLQEILQEAKDREKLLADINERLNEAKLRLEKLKINELLVAYAGYQGNLEEQEQKKYLLEEYFLKIEVLTNKLVELGKKEQLAADFYYDARKAADENDEHKQINSLEQENVHNLEEQKRLLREAAIYKQTEAQLANLKANLQKFGFVCTWQELLDASQDTKLAIIKQAQQALSAMEEDIKNYDATNRTETLTCENLCKSLEAKKKKLESGVMDYPEEAILVKNKINALLGEQNLQADAKLFCELLYMTDASWQDAVESYLNTQRFNIIVAPENYLFAKKAFIALGDKVRGIGLVDTRKLSDIKYAEAEVSYLGDKVESENLYAKRYVRYLLKNIICCDDKDDLELYAKSVTKDRYKFQNYCLQRMRKQEHFIGVDAIAKQLANTKRELLANQKVLSELKDKQRDFSTIYSEFNKFILGNSFVNLEQYCASEQFALELGVKIEEIKAKVAEFKQSPLLLAMYNRLDECQINWNKIKGELTKATAEKQNLEGKVHTIQADIKTLSMDSVSLQAEYESNLQDYPELASDVQKKYHDERRLKTAKNIVANFSNQVAKDNIVYYNYVNQQLLPLQRTYTNKYACDYLEGLAGAGRYQQEYAVLQNIELERHNKELAQAQARCKERFRKEILFRMKDDILRARQQFKQINRVMEHLEYGEESYRFGIDKSKDKELALFYDIIMDKDNQQIEQEDNLFSFAAEADKSEVFEHQLDDFMSRIMIDVEEHAKENLSGEKLGAKSMGVYVDYRTYLDYDIIVTNSVTQNEVALSKVSGEGSGGENQAPFYVAICASLLQIYEQNPDGCMRLVLLDEAFNNMTSDRIAPMMTMFKNLHLQLMLIATPEKATVIQPFCDITYSIVKSGNRNSIQPFARI